ncbi:MAG TPA: antibiotic biosynthesis monooxygenase [Polyangiaceae bacterium]|nr:antibiotic biosynthesis monooxygenase [Polyangiaceae bacterium]
MAVGVLIELRVKQEYLDRFLHATRLYCQYTRKEPGRPRVEIFELEAGVGGFMVRETFHNQAALDAHSSTAHARQWLATVTPFLEGALRRQRAVVVLSEPPPVPRPARPPALEASTSLPRTKTDAVKWRPFARSDDRVPSAAYAAAAPLQLPRVQVAVERIEVASVHDGFLRGAPEPCILIGCYSLNGAEPAPLGRALYRFSLDSLDSRAPCTLAPCERVLDLPVLIERFPVRLCVLLLAFEENGSSDIRSAYQDLADPASFFVWSSRHSEPDPLRVGAHAATLQPNHCDRVHMLRDGEPLHAAAHDDTWIGAASGVIEFTGPGQETVLRYHTRSLDGRNDWLTELSFRLLE